MNKILNLIQPQYILVGTLFGILIFTGIRDLKHTPSNDPSTLSGLSVLEQKSSWVDKFSLVQLKTNLGQETKGSIGYVFFVGGGSLQSQEEPYYMFYVKSSDGGIKMIRQDISNVVIYESSNSTPSAEYLDFSPAVCTPNGDNNKCQHWILTIPEGSVVNKIDVNLPNK